MKMKIKYFLYPILFLIFAGCSGKSQINPEPNQYDDNTKSKDSYFYLKQNQNKALEAKYKEGESAGYERAKDEFEKIIPYLEALRASAELANSGGICYGPLFLDKSDSSGVKVLLGDAHLCDNLTVDRILKIVKSGIPGLPDYLIKSNSVSQNQLVAPQSTISSIDIAGIKKNDFFIEQPEAKKEPLTVKVKDTYTNRQILRESNNFFSKVELDSSDKNFLVIEFNDKNTLDNFCDKFNVCIKG